MEKYPQTPLIDTPVDNDEDMDEAPTVRKASMRSRGFAKVGDADED